MDPFLIDTGIGLFTFFLGLVIGNWLAIGRDKRKERLAAITPVRSKFLTAKLSPSPFSARPSIEELDLVERHFWKCKRMRFRQALKHYGDICQIYEVRSKSGDVTYSDTKEIKQAIDVLLRKFLNYP